jgi:hypothetical protein
VAARLGVGIGGTGARGRTAGRPGAGGFLLAAAPSGCAWEKGRGGQVGPTGCEKEGEKEEKVAAAGDQGGARGDARFFLGP